MSEITITSSKINKTYELKNENIIVNGSYQTDEQSGELQTVQGSCYRNQDGNMGAYIGNFMGTQRDGEVKYSLSEMSRKDSMLVWNAIDEIEQNILPQEL
jgi:hypothetical protein